MASSEQNQPTISVPETLDAAPGPERPDLDEGALDHPYVRQMEGGANPLGYAMGNPRRESENAGDRKQVLARVLVHFWHGYRKVRDTFGELREAIERGDSAQARESLWQVRRFLGPHVRYEDEAILPALQETLGEAHIEALRTRPEEMTERIRSLSDLIDAGLDDKTRVDRGRALVQELLVHTAAMAGLTLLIETLPLDALKTLLEVRERALIEGIELLEWVGAHREHQTDRGGRVITRCNH